MIIYNYDIKDLPVISDRLVLLVGKFDGVHIGHQKLIKEAKEIAKANNLKIGILTFEPHPLVLFSKEVIRELSTFEEKQIIFSNLDVDHFIALKFDLDLASLSKEEFLSIIESKLNIDTIIVGNDFRFGAKASGTPNDLLERGYNVVIVNDIQAQNDEKIGSSLIRQILRSGNIKEANRLLGRPFSVRGEVVPGAQIGRTINYPTANVSIQDKKILPDTGVYVVDVLVDGTKYRGIANIGVNPTVTDKNVLKLEVHILDFKQDIYGKVIEVLFLSRVRSEKKFNGLDALKKQLHEDELVARRFK